MKITNDMIHPELRTYGKIIRLFLPYFKNSTFKKIDRIRKLIFKGKSSKKIELQEIFIPRSKDSRAKGLLRICVFTPKSINQDKNQDSCKKPGILWIHGGGYAMGFPEQNERVITEFVLKYGCTVISPDYCLSFEAPYPAALFDCYETLLWMKNNADAYGFNSSQLMVGGESAGGGLTIATTIFARDRGEVAIAYQSPLYPMIDDRMITESSQDNNSPLWNTRSNKNGWQLYLGDLYGAENVPVYAAPSRLSDYSNLPPAFTFIGDIDPFYDEVLAFFNQLKEAGIPANCKVFKGCFHAFDVIAPKSTPGSEARKLLFKEFEYAMEHYFAEN